jgi:hypothetical protein
MMYETMRSVGPYHPRLNTNIDEGELRLLQRNELMKELPHLWNDLVALRALEHLNLGVYRHGREYLIGVKSSTVHPHDQWLFRAVASENWLEVPVEGSPYHGDAVEDLRHPLGVLRSVCEAARLHGRHKESTPGEILELAMLLRMPLRYYGNIMEYLNYIPEGLAPQTLHELLHHYPRWQRRNPEFKDLPQNLALRMHGLGQLLDSGYKGLSAMD